MIYTCAVVAIPSAARDQFKLRFCFLGRSPHVDLPRTVGPAGQGPNGKGRTPNTERNGFHVLIRGPNGHGRGSAEPAVLALLLLSQISRPSAVAVVISIRPLAETAGGEQTLLLKRPATLRISADRRAR